MQSAQVGPQHGFLFLEYSPIRFFGVLIAVLALPSCAYLSPQVTLDPKGTTFDASHPMPHLEVALSKIEAWTSTVENKSDSTTWTRRGLNIATFVFASGVAVATIRSTSKNRIQNLGLGAAAAYSAGTLFASDDQATLYDNANTALFCIFDRGAALRSTVVDQQVRLQDDVPNKLTEHAVGTNCQPDKETQDKLTKSELARDAAIAAIDQVATADMSIATKVTGAARNVVQELRKQLRLIAPSSDAILNAAKSGGGLANGGISANATSQLGKSKALTKAQNLAACPVTSGPVVEALRAQLAQLQQTYEGIQNTVVQQLNAIAALDTACTLTPAKLDLLAFNTQEVTVATDASQTATISGGREPYTWQWSGTAPKDDVKAQLILPRTLVINGTSTLVPGRAYAIEVRDSALGSKPITLSIKTK